VPGLRYTALMKMYRVESFLGGMMLAAILAICGCSVAGRAGESSSPATGLRGHLLIIGGGLDDDNKPVYERFIVLASAPHLASDGVPRIVIASAASGDQDAASKSKVESLRAYSPLARIDVIRRETPPDEAVVLIDQATAMFFTGGDQKRITTSYRPDGIDRTEASAMRRLLARGGVIAGTSAGDAMMSDPMFLTGRSAEALGIRSTRTTKSDDDDADDKRAQPPLGPQIGGGMGFLPWAITDSHFFERNRFGRLVAALEASGKRLGIGVGEDACAEVNLATGEIVGISVADSLLVDVASLTREGLIRRGVRATVIRQGLRRSLIDPALHPQQALAASPSTTEEVPIVEPGQNRQLASWRFFMRAQSPGTPAQLLKLDGYEQRAWPDEHGSSIVELRPTAP